MTFFNTADENWQKVSDDVELRGVLCTGWEKWLEEYGQKLRIGDGSNKWCQKGRAEILVRRIAATKLMVVTIVIKEV